jgi:hypothetical protein
MLGKNEGYTVWPEDSAGRVKLQNKANQGAGYNTMIVARTLIL